MASLPNSISDDKTVSELELLLAESRGRAADLRRAAVDVEARLRRMRVALVRKVDREPLAVQTDLARQFATPDGRAGMAAMTPAELLNRFRVVDPVSDGQREEARAYLRRTFDDVHAAVLERVMKITKGHLAESHLLLERWLGAGSPEFFDWRCPGQPRRSMHRLVWPYEDFIRKQRDAVLKKSVDKYLPLSKAVLGELQYLHVRRELASASAASVSASAVASAAVSPTASASASVVGFSPTSTSAPTSCSKSASKATSMSASKPSAYSMYAPKAPSMSTSTSTSIPTSTSTPASNYMSASAAAYTSKSSPKSTSKKNSPSTSASASEVDSAFKSTQTSASDQTSGETEDRSSTASAISESESAQSASASAISASASDQPASASAIETTMSTTLSAPPATASTAGAAGTVTLQSLADAPGIGHVSFPAKGTEESRIAAESCAEGCDEDDDCEKIGDALDVGLIDADDVEGMDINTVSGKMDEPAPCHKIPVLATTTPIRGSRIPLAINPVSPINVKSLERRLARTSLSSSSPSGAHLSSCGVLARPTPLKRTLVVDRVALETPIERDEDVENDEEATAETSLMSFNDAFLVDIGKIDLW